MPDTMTIAAPGVQTAIPPSSPAAPAAAQSDAPAMQNSAPAPLDHGGFILAYNPNAPFANLQDLVAVPDTGSQAALTGALQTSNGAPANPVVYRIASHLYRSLQDL
jgi:hypothetical protein